MLPGTWYRCLVYMLCPQASPAGLCHPHAFPLLRAREEQANGVWANKLRAVFGLIAGNGVRADRLRANCGRVVESASRFLGAVSPGDEGDERLEIAVSKGMRGQWPNDQ